MNAAIERKKRVRFDLNMLTLSLGFRVRWLADCVQKTCRDKDISAPVLAVEFVV
jgi:hypothetical protein